MGSTRSAFTPEYKQQSVAFVLDGGRSVAEVARNIGVHEMTLSKWVKVARAAAESGANPDARRLSFPAGILNFESSCDG
jgi:transposase